MSFDNTNKRKIINDPIYGFIPISNEIIFDIIEHPYFQRLRRIKQLGLTHLVYPGALHTRFHHSLGATFLMGKAIAELRTKGHHIDHEEELGVLSAILLHDIGHGPFSHALEYSIGEGIHHEEISKLFLSYFNQFHDNKLQTGINIFNDQHKKKFLHKLVSSQLDMDRIDYLKRDSFYTGVSEGVVNAERIIKMLFVDKDRIVVEEKGIYSIEKFIIARRLMYWQVYLHKTVLAAENMLIKILRRARELSMQGKKLFATRELTFFLEQQPGRHELLNDEEVIKHFSGLDDFDIYAALKAWQHDDDPVLSKLCSMILGRQLFGTELENEAFPEEKISMIREAISKEYKLTEELAEYFIISDSTENHAYHPKSDKINILYKSGKVMDIAHASDQLNITVLHKTVTKYFLCYPKEIRDCL